MKNPFEPTEKEIQNSILAYLELSGHFVWRNNSGVVKQQDKYGHTRMWRAGIKGGSDILGVAKDGRMIAVECKRKGNKTTPIQEAFLDEVAKRGGYAKVAYSLDDVSDLL